VSAAADLEEAQAVSTSAVEVNASSSASTLSVKDGEGDAAKYQSDNATTSSNTSVGTLVDTVVNNASISSRSTTPKSELGYNTDSESGMPLQDLVFPLLMLVVVLCVLRINIIYIYMSVYMYMI